MSERAFRFWLVAIGVAGFLSALPFPGAMMGFFVGVAIAFFVAGPLMLLLAALERSGVTISLPTVLYGAAGLYAAATLVALWLAFKAWSGEDRFVARLKAMRAILLIALPLIAYLASQALVDAWP
jgi:hypothetical protein